MSHRRGNVGQSEIHRLMQMGVAIPAWRPDGDYSWWTGTLPRLHQNQTQKKKQMPLIDPILGFAHRGD